MKKICSNCEYEWQFGKWSKIRMLLFGKITHTCPICLTRTEWVLIHHPVKVRTNKIKKRGVWRNA